MEGANLSEMHRRVVALALGALAFCIYSPTIGNGTVIDDDDLLHAELSPADLLFSPGPPADAKYYRPITVSTYEVLHVFGQGQAEVRAAHVSSLLLYASVVAGVYLLTVAMLGEARYAKEGAVFATFLFALHPIHTESVAYITARPDVLVALWILLALATHSLFWRSGRWYWFVASGCAVLAAPLSKETGVTAFVLLPAFHWLSIARGPMATTERREPSERPHSSKRRRGGAGRATRAPTWRPSPNTPLWCLGTLGACMLVYLGLRLIAFGALGSSGLELRELEPARVLGAVGFYSEKLFAPHHLLTYYATTPASPLNVIAGALALTALLAGIWLSLLKGEKVMAFGLFWLLFTLLPSMPVFVAGPSFAPVAERYLFLPSVGLAIVAAAGAARILQTVMPEGEDAASSAFGKPQFVWLPALGLVLGTAFAFTTVTRFASYKSLRTYYETAVRDNPSAGFPHAGLGAEYQREGRLDEAKQQFRLAVTGKLRDEPRAQAWNSLGALYAQGGDFEEALDAYNRAIALWNENGSFHFNLALLYRADALRSDPADDSRLSLAAHEAELAAGFDPKRQDDLLLVALIALDRGDIRSVTLPRFPGLLASGHHAAPTAAVYSRS